MSIIDISYRTVTCDGCGKTATFEQKKVEQAVEEYPWLKTLRIIQNASGRNFAYHDDVCELKGVGDGAHNPIEPKKVALADGVSGIQAAAAHAKATEQAAKAIREGAGLHLVTTEG